MQNVLSAKRFAKHFSNKQFQTTVCVYSGGGEVVVDVVHLFLAKLHRYRAVQRYDCYFIP